MMKIKNVIVADKFFGDMEYVVIYNEDGSETSMAKSVYDEMIANQNQAPTLPQVESSN